MQRRNPSRATVMSNLASMSLSTWNRSSRRRNSRTAVFGLLFLVQGLSPKNPAG